MKTMRMSIRRLEALISCAVRGMTDLEDDAEHDAEVRAEMQAAQEGIWYLHEWLDKMKEAKS